MTGKILTLQILEAMKTKMLVFVFITYRGTTKFSVKYFFNSFGRTFLWTSSRISCLIAGENNCCTFRASLERSGEYARE